MNGLAIRGIESYMDLGNWPDHKTGIVLLATQFADRFFSEPSDEGGNMVAAIVKGPEAGKEGRGLRLLTLVPMTDFNSAEEKAAWGALFAMMMGESDAIAGFQAFEGRMTVATKDGAASMNRQDAFCQIVFTHDDGPIQLRTTPFKRNDDGVAVPVGAVTVVEEDELNGAEGRLLGRRANANSDSDEDGD